MRIVLTFVLALSAGSANAAFISGNDIMTLCRESRAELGGYIAGWFDKGSSDKELTLSSAKKVKDFGSMIELHYLAGSLSSGACFPKTVTIGQLVDIVCKYASENPAQRQLDGGAFLDKSISEALPCPKD